MRVKHWRGERGQRTTLAVTAQPRGERKLLSSLLPPSTASLAPPASLAQSSLADACVTLFLQRRSCNSPSLPLFLSSPSTFALSSFRYVLAADARRGATVSLSLSSSLSRYLSLSLSRFPFLPPCRSLFLLRSRLFSFSLVRLRIRIQRKSATPLPRVRPSCFVFQRLFLLRSPLSALPPTSRHRHRRDVHRGPPSSLCIFHSTTCAALPPSRTLRLPSCRFLRLYRGRGSMSLSPPRDAGTRRNHFRCSSRRPIGGEGEGEKGYSRRTICRRVGSERKTVGRINKRQRAYR